MEEYKSDTPLEDRKSQKLTFGNFVKDAMVWQYLPLVAGVVGFTWGRLGKAGKLPKNGFPFDGSPTIVQKGWEYVAEKIAGKVVGKAASKNMAEGLKEIKEERLEFITRPIHGNDKEARISLQSDIFNTVKALEFSAVPLLYHLWRNKEDKKINLEEASNRLHAIQTVKPTDAELRVENASLEQQLAFIERQRGEHPHGISMKISPERAHEGKITHTHVRDASPVEPPVPGSSHADAIAEERGAAEHAPHGAAL